VDASLDHYLLRQLLKDLVTSSGGHLVALLDDAKASGANQSKLTFGVIDVVVDRAHESVELIDRLETDSKAQLSLQAFRTWVSNVAAVTPRLRQRIRSDFGDGSFNEVLWALGCLPGSDWPPGERLPAAVLLYADGDWHRLLAAVKEANMDWRDALMLGGLGHTDWPDRLKTEFG